MKTKLFLLAAAIAAVGALSGPAVAATGHAPVLDREQLTTWYGSAVVGCHYDSTRSHLTVDYTLRGRATLPFVTSGTATFAVTGGDTALQNGQTSVTCNDLAGYIDQVAAARGKTVPAATADTLIAKAKHIRVVLGC